MISIALLGVLVGCGGSKTHAEAAPATVVSPQRVAVEASNFKFTPDHIDVMAGSPVLIVITNVAGERHNLTIQDHDGKAVVSQDIPGHETRTVNFLPERPGTYPFRCDVDGHAELGMKGVITARPPG